MQLHPAWPLLLHPLQVEQQSVLLAVCQHQVVEGYWAHPLVTPQVAQHSFERKRGSGSSKAEIIVIKNVFIVKKDKGKYIEIWISAAFNSNTDSFVFTYLD